MSARKHYLKLFTTASQCIVLTEAVEASAASGACAGRARLKAGAVKQVEAVLAPFARLAVGAAL
jgi:hypothetical protein